MLKFAEILTVIESTFFKIYKQTKQITFGKAKFEIMQITQTLHYTS